MSTIGKTQITITFISPTEHVAEGDRIFASHAKWMEETHHRTGELAMLRYNIIKGPKLENPLSRLQPRQGIQCSSWTRCTKIRRVSTITGRGHRKNGKTSVHW